MARQRRPHNLWRGRDGPHNAWASRPPKVPPGHFIAGRGILSRAGASYRGLGHFIVGENIYRALKNFSPPERLSRRSRLLTAAETGRTQKQTWPHTPPEHTSPTEKMGRPKCRKMTKNGPKRPKMTQNDSFLPNPMTQNGHRLKKAILRAKWPKPS